MANRTHLKVAAFLCALVGTLGSASDNPLTVASALVVFALGGLAYIASFFAKSA